MAKKKPKPKAKPVAKAPAKEKPKTKAKAAKSKPAVAQSKSGKASKPAKKNEIEATLEKLGGLLKAAHLMVIEGGKEKCIGKIVGAKLGAEKELYFLAELDEKEMEPKPATGPAKIAEDNSEFESDDDDEDFSDLDDDEDADEFDDGSNFDDEDETENQNESENDDED